MSTTETPADATRKPERLIRMPEVKDRTGLGKTTIYEWMRDGRFPKAVPVGINVAWVESEVEAWVAAQIALRDQQDDLPKAA